MIVKLKFTEINTENRNLNFNYPAGTITNLFLHKSTTETSAFFASSKTVSGTLLNSCIATDNALECFIVYLEMDDLLLSTYCIFNNTYISGNLCE